jgi:hypothetical protein
MKEIGEFNERVQVCLDVFSITALPSSVLELIDLVWSRNDLNPVPENFAISSPSIYVDGEMESPKVRDRRLLIS